MVKLILTVPRSFDAEKFMNIASELTRARLGEDYDLDLGDYLSPRIGASRVDEYELDGANITLEQLDVITDLQKICPDVKTRIQTGEDEDTGDELELFIDIANRHRDEIDSRDGIDDIFTDIVNAHHRASI